MTKPVPQNTEKNPASVSAPSTTPDSSWTEDDISFRRGNCNILLIAPHGHGEDDKKTYEITRLAADQLGCYAFVTKIYQKPPEKKDPKTKKILVGLNGKPIRHDPDKKKKWINLNRKNQVQKYLESEFENPLQDTVDEIIKEYGKAFVVWIHGIDGENLTPDNTAGNLPSIDALIGVGQGNPDKLTANMGNVDKLIAALQSNPVKPIKAALARSGSDYCGRHKNIMNQYFLKEYSLDKVESIQIEIRKRGFRDNNNFAGTAVALSDSLSSIFFLPPAEKEHLILDSAVQKGTIQHIKVDAIDMENIQFMSRLDEINSDADEFKRLVKSVEKDGVLINIIVRRHSGTGGKQYQLISGFRRMTALKESLSEKEFVKATVPARILEAAITDEEAYRISFTENLIRKDLSLWEIAQACSKIKEEKRTVGKMNDGEIDKYIAELIHKDDRTVRRYLKLASIKNKDIKEAVHNGSINYLDALEIGEKDFEEGDISALLGHLKVHPKSTRDFKLFYDNLEHCCDISGLSMAEVLLCKNADEFLSLEKEELKTRIEHLHNETGKDYQDILKGRAGALIKETGEIDAGLEKRKGFAEFQKDNKDISKSVYEAFIKSNINGKFKIKPILGSTENQVTVTITAPKTEIWKAINAVSKANKDTEKVIQKENPKALPS